MHSERQRANIKKKDKKKFWGIFIIVILSLSGVVLFINSLQTKKPVITIPKEAATTETVKKRLFTLYFPSDSGKLSPEYREAVEGSNIIENIKIAVVSLIKGSKSGLKSTIPLGTKPMGVWIDADGICYLNFSRDIQQISGGALEEMLAVDTIVETVCSNFPQIKGIKILIDGADADTLSGHIDISSPLMPNKVGDS